MAPVFGRRLIGLGIAAALLCAGCTSGSGHKETSGPSRSPGSRSLAQLPDAPVTQGVSIALQSELTPPAHIIGEARIGADDLVAYTTGDRCGLLVLRAAQNFRTLISMTTAWPSGNGSGTDLLPGGPYIIGTSPGSFDPDSFASVSCGRDAMVVEYSTTPGAGSAHAESGPVSVIRPGGGNPSTVVVVGSRASRQALSRHFA